MIWGNKGRRLEEGEKIWCAVLAEEKQFVKK
jgi:hypothetical protein